jgi:CBS domain-containing protein
MKTVSMLLQEKGHVVWTVSPSDLVIYALRLMAENNIGAVPVVENDEVVGIFSERDYARRGDLQGHPASATQVSELMTRLVICISQDLTADECLAIMTSRHIRHLPVVKQDRLIGIISIGDAVKAIISDQAFVIEQLERYITLPH